MKNDIQEGKILVLTAPYARSSGEGALIGTLFGVAVSDVANGAEGVFMVEGVLDIAKASGAISQGAKVYWDDTAKNLTTTSSGNTLVAKAVVAALTGDATVRAKLINV